MYRFKDINSFQKTRLYVAYGSNMNTSQMQHRCPGAQHIGVVDIPGYKLAFMHHGVATILPDEQSSIKGLAWRITPSNEDRLDRYEGAPYFYVQQQITVSKDGSDMEMMAYIMNPEFHVPGLPSEPYYECIAQAYDEFGLDTAPLERALGEAALAVRDGRLHRPPARRPGRWNLAGCCLP